MNILLLKSLTCMICTTQRRAPHVSMEAMQSTSRPAGWGISWYPSHGMRSTLQWGYCSMACDASHVTWSDRRPGYVVRFRNLMLSLRARRAAELGYTLQYCSQDNSRASTDRGSLTRYMRGGAFDGAFKTLCASWFAFMLRWPSGANYLYLVNFWFHYSAEYE